MEPLKVRDLLFSVIVNHTTGDVNCRNSCSEASVEFILLDSYESLRITILLLLNRLFSEDNLVKVYDRELIYPAVIKLVEYDASLVLIAFQSVRQRVLT